MGRRKGGDKGTNISEAARVSLQLQLQNLIRSDSAELALPSSLSKPERAYVHARALALGLRTKSRNKGAKRFVTVYKRSQSTLVQKDAVLTLEKQLRESIAELMHLYPITTKEKDDLNTERERTTHISTGGHLMNGAPLVPSSQHSPEILAFKKTLPVYSNRDQIVELINSNQVVVVVAETGSGKTTQIPQLIMDQHQHDKKPCRLICTQPRRISAVSVAERVSYERSEKIGQSVGYQIRLESRISQKTILTYCTTGVLLRTLMSGGAALSSVTHIFVDEAHERDKLTDFLLISLKEAISRFKDLKVVIMSATVDATLFSRYFNNCPMFRIPGRVFDVQKIYLEEILAITKYKSEAMKRIEPNIVFKMKRNVPEIQQVKKEPEIVDLKKCESIDPDLQIDVDEFLNDCLSSGSVDSFGQILYMYISEGVPIDCPHSETGMTGLMVAAYHGYMEAVEQIIKMGSDQSISDKSGKKAYDYAIAKGQEECANFLLNLNTESVRAQQNLPVQEEKIDIALEAYQQSVPENTVDFDLMLALIKHIHLTQPKGGILIFLTGYDEIIYLRDALQMCSEMRNGSYQLFTLHSNMQTADQKKVFVRSSTIRKIILSTNIAETSITIDDVVYVIDSGKVKEMYYETLKGVSSLQRCWISKACALQRAGRAGRTQPGVAYMIYSKRRFESFADQSTAEILRVPLHELCLQSKLLAPCNTSIVDYLAKAIEPPSYITVRNSVNLLKTIGALTQNEDLTEIGQHLLGLSIEPKLGKMVLYACILKCLDPVLIIACSLAIKEPFQINSDKDKKNIVNELRKEFAADSLSDHMGLLRAFQAWQNARLGKTEKKFCKDNSISKATMEMIVGLRTQLLAQLRVMGFVKAKGPGDVKDLNQNSEKWYVIKAALVSGLYPSIARIDRDEMTLRTSKEAKNAFHPRSALHMGSKKSDHKESISKIPSDWIVFDEIMRIGRLCFIRCNTVVTPITIALFGGPLRLLPTALKANLPGLSDDSDSDQEEGEAALVETTCLSLDDWISFIAVTQDLLSIYLLRQKFSALIIRRMLNPSKPPGQMDEKIVSTIVHVLGREEKNVGLIQPTGIGRRPITRQFSNDNMMPYDMRNQNPNSQVLLNLYNNNNQGNYYFKQNKSQGTVMQNFAGNKGPISPPSGNILLANIEKYTNASNESSNSSTSKMIQYFIIKALEANSIKISQNVGLWNFSDLIKKKLIKVAQSGIKPLLIFSVDADSRFYGYAEFSNTQSENDPLMYVIKWISNNQISHYATRNIMNALNENRRVNATKDGQEICAESGKALISLMDQQSKKFHNNGRPIQKHTT